MQRVLVVSLILHMLALASLLVLRLPAAVEPEEPARIEVVFGDSGVVPPRPVATTSLAVAAPTAEPRHPSDPGEGAPAVVSPPAAPDAAPSATPLVAPAQPAAPDPGLRVDEPDPLMIPTRDVAGNQAPDYPEEARHLHQQGTVLLRLHIGIDGVVARIETLKSSGVAALDEAARATLAQWHFLPAERAGQPVASYRDQPVSFVLE